MGYPEFTTRAELMQWMKRKRKMYMVIFNEGGDLLPVKCAKCGEDIVDDGNRVKVYPREKVIIPLHYDCAWAALFDKIGVLADAMRV